MRNRLLTITHGLQATAAAAALIAGAARARADAPAELTVTPSPLTLDFGVVRAETGSKTITFTVANTAVDPADWLTYYVDGLPPDDQEWTTTVNGTSGFRCDASRPCQLPPGVWDEYVVTFHPQGVHFFSNPVKVVAEPPLVAEVDGTLTAAGGQGFLSFATPSPLILPPALEGQTSTGTLTISNTGNYDLDVGQIVVPPGLGLTGGPSPVFTLAPNASASWTVSCLVSTPDGGGGTLELDADDYQGWHLYDVGCPAIAPEPVLEVDGPIDFGEVALGDSATSRAHVTNTGTGAATLVAITSDDPRFTAELVTGALPLAIDVGATVDVDVTFTPTDDTAATATITFDAASGVDPQLAVSGRTAPEPPPPPPPPPHHGCSSSGPGGGAIPFALIALAIARIRRRAPRSRGR